jgi:hypothetical protein
MKTMRLNINGADNRSLILFVARRDIEPLEQLRFDYGDKRASEMFGDN